MPLIPEEWLGKSPCFFGSILSGRYILFHKTMLNSHSNPQNWSGFFFFPFIQYFGCCCIMLIVSTLPERLTNLNCSCKKRGKNRSLVPPWIPGQILCKNAWNSGYVICTLEFYLFIIIIYILYSFQYIFSSSPFLGRIFSTSIVLGISLFMQQYLLLFN